ncbi:VOC family protein [Paenibacillus shenyangensis]|uniref:VOC family protein n=1 Tax=Paenibacillus sp. A9 TaxID=1284352 RepID=UPI0003669328|nr:VOC family protein [Paenibacillus sp. A9]
MNFASVRIITDDVDRLVEFYEKVTGIVAQRPAPVFAEIVMGAGTLAIGHSQTAQLFGVDSVVAASNRTMIIELRVKNLEAEHERLKQWVDKWVQEPTLMPWGNRSMLFRDPDGNLVNLFEPVSEAAIERFRDR